MSVAYLDVELRLRGGGGRGRELLALPSAFTIYIIVFKPSEGGHSRSFMFSCSITYIYRVSVYQITWKIWECCAPCGSQLLFLYNIILTPPSLVRRQMIIFIIKVNEWHSSVVWSNIFFFGIFPLLILVWISLNISHV